MKLSLTKRPFQASLVLIAAFLLSACGGGTDDIATPEEQFGNLVDTSPREGSVDAEPPAALPLDESNDATTTTIETTPPTTETAPDDPSEAVLPVSGEGDEPRVTSEGIRVGTVSRSDDFGNGPEDFMMIAASSGAGEVATIFDEELVASTATIDYDIWAASGGVAVIRVEVSPQVVEVRLTGGEGGVDRVAPDAAGFAILGVRAGGAADLFVEGLDSAGAVVGTCEFDGRFLECTD